jgi:glycosyltransferase involved in cell wall biosynthesis
MAVLAVVTSSPPGVEGGHLVIGRSIVAAARESGHDARLVITPDHGFGRQASAYWQTWRFDISHVDGVKVDQVISLRYPSYAVRHPAHVCWLNHPMHEYYDLWPRLTASISRANFVKESVRRTLIRVADSWLLTRNVTKLLAQSRTIQRLLVDELGIRPDVLWPPPPPRAYRCDAYDGYIFTVSRLMPLKRIDLLIRALAEPAALRVRAVIAGEGEEAEALAQLAAQLGVANRARFLGRIDDETMLRHLATCRAVYFAPFAEDYGFVTVEAFASRKAVITCSDSGGPTELVRDEATGLVCEPTPAAVALALARVTDDAAFAERLGARAAEQAAAMTWPDAMKRLMIV